MSLARTRLPASERRLHILDAAVDTFGRGNYRAVGTAALADAAGVSEATLFKYFDSKKHLFIATLGHAARRLLAELDAARDGSDTTQPEGWLEAMTAAVDRRRAATRVLFEAAVEGDDPEIRGAAWEAIAGIITQFTENIEQFTSERADAETGAWWAFSQYLLLFYLQSLEVSDRLPRQALREMRAALIEWIEAR